MAVNSYGNNLNLIVNSIIVLVLLLCGCISQFYPEEVVRRPFGEAGEYAELYLKGDPYTRIIIEVDFVEGFAPYESTEGNYYAFELLKSKIYKYCNKTDVKIFISSRIQAIYKLEKNYTLAEIKSLETKYRRYYNNNENAIIYVLYVDGVYRDDTYLFGLAYGRSSIVIFKGSILMALASIKGSIGTENYEIWLKELEAVVLLHTFGKLLGLVRSEPPEGVDAHEDIDHRGYCNTTLELDDKKFYPDCVMSYMVVYPAILKVRQQLHRFPSEFCSYCELELQKVAMNSN